MRTILMSFAIVLLLLLNLVQYHLTKYNPILEYHTTTKPQIGDVLILEDIDSNGTIHIVPEDQSNENTHHLQLIWNADDEGMPAVGGLIEVEQIDNNKFYLIPHENN